MKPIRPYQLEACCAIDDNIKSTNRMLLVMATGTGKTRTGIEIIERRKFKRTLWLSDRKHLITQSGMAFIENKFDKELYNHVKEIGFLKYVISNISHAGSGFKMGVIKASIFEPNANVVMGSVQTVWRRLDRLPPDYFDCIICDEAHGYASKTAQIILDYFKPELLLGITATPYRLDGLQLSNIFDKTVYEYPLIKGIQEGYLCELEGIRVKTKVSLDDVHTLGGDFNEKELAEEVNTLARNNLVAESYLKYAKGRQAIGFAVNIEHALDLAAACREYDINAEAVSSNEERTPDSERKIQDFIDSKIDVLFNVGILTTGFDHPNIGAILEACPTKSLTKYLQTVGRGTRLKDEDYVSKFGQNCLVIDFVDITDKHSLINTWNLDHKLPLEERVFLTREMKDKIIEARRVKLEGNLTDKDTKVQLLPIKDKPKINSVRMTESATQAQIDFLKVLGYSTDNDVYTKKMVNDIIDALPALKKDIERLKELGFDVNGQINRGQAKYNIWLYEQKQNRK